MSGASVGEVLAVWACLLECASTASGGDAVTTCDASQRHCDDSVTSQAVTVTRGDVTRFDCDDCDVMLGFGDGRCDAIVTAMTSRGLIIDGRLAGWEDRQQSKKPSGTKAPTSGAARTRAYRERKKALAAGDVTVTGVTSPVTGVTPGDACDGQIKREIEKENSNTPPNPPAGGKAPAKPKAKAPAAPADKPARAKPKRSLPMPFLMTAEMLAWAAESAPAVTLDRETEKFIDYWTGQGGTKADWHATWRNWIRRAQDDLEKRGLTKPAGKGGTGSDTDWIHEDDGV